MSVGNPSPGGCRPSRIASTKSGAGCSSRVLVDELGQIGTRQLLDLLRLQAEQGFKVVAVGDERQCQSIEAGPVIGLLREALGPGAIPEVLTTASQRGEREREIGFCCNLAMPH